MSAAPLAEAEASDVSDESDMSSETDNQINSVSVGWLLLIMLKPTGTDIFVGFIFLFIICIL